MRELIDRPLRTRSLRGSRGLTADNLGSAGFRKFLRTSTRVGGGGLVSLESVFVISFFGCRLAERALVRFFFDDGGGVESRQACSCGSGGSDSLEKSEGGRDECGVDDLAAGA
jgi:hypothetical protein